MNLRTPLFIPLLAATLLAACSSTPERIDVLEDARSTIAEVDAHPRAGQVAGNELEDAREALQNAEYLYANNGDYDEIFHQSYLALRHAEIAQERIAEAEAREQIKRSEAERAQVLLTAREAEAIAAKQRAAEREREADAAKSVARARELQAEQARDIAAAKAAEAEENALEAEIAREQAEAALEEQRRLHVLLIEMEAEKTDRGYVLTLGDILFDTDKAVLKPGADITMDRLAEFLAEYPERNLLIEGHADSRGSDNYNVSLSTARANAVKLALIDRGVEPGRLDVNGLGEHYPVASNETDAGQQQNRRVEIVVSDAEGSFPAAAMRTAFNQR